MFITGRRRWPRLNHAEIVRRTRILVIDDQAFPYIDLFKRDGYTIDKWDSVHDLGPLENGHYDVILLDLLGVGTAESADEGLGILKHIRSASPTQLVVAYSNAEWSLAYQPFFDDADATLHKTKADYVEFKRTVDRLLDQRFSLGFYLARVSAELGEDNAVAQRAVGKARKAILSGKVDPLRDYLKGRIDDSRTVERVLAIVQVAIGIAAL